MTHSTFSWKALLVTAAIPLTWLVDAAAGAHLAFNGPLGMNALVAGRFYGVNNIAFSQAGAGIVVVLGALAGLLAARGRPRSAVILAVAAGLAAVWAWARQHWSMARVPRRRAVPAPRYG